MWHTWNRPEIASGGCTCTVYQWLNWRSYKLSVHCTWCNVPVLSQCVHVLYCNVHCDQCWQVELKMCRYISDYIVRVLLSVCCLCSDHLCVWLMCAQDEPQVWVDKLTPLADLTQRYTLLTTVTCTSCSLLVDIQTCLRTHTSDILHRQTHATYNIQSYMDI